MQGVLAKSMEEDRNQIKYRQLETGLLQVDIAVCPFEVTLQYAYVRLAIYPEVSLEDLQA